MLIILFFKNEGTWNGDKIQAHLPGPGTRTLRTSPGPWASGPGPRAPGPGPQAPGPAPWAQGPRPWAPSPEPRASGPGPRALGSRPQAPGTGHPAPSWAPGPQAPSWAPEPRGDDDQFCHLARMHSYFNVLLSHTYTFVPGIHCIDVMYYIHI